MLEAVDSPMLEPEPEPHTCTLQSGSRVVCGTQQYTNLRYAIRGGEEMSEEIPASVRPKPAASLSPRAGKSN